MKLSSNGLIEQNFDQKPNKNPRMFLQCSKCDAHLMMGETFDLPKCPCGGDTQITIDDSLIHFSVTEILEQALGCSIDLLMNRTLSTQEFLHELLNKSPWTFEEICALTVLILMNSAINEPLPLEAYDFGLAIGLVMILDEQKVI